MKNIIKKAPLFLCFFSSMFVQSQDVAESTIEEQILAAMIKRGGMHYPIGNEASDTPPAVHTNQSIGSFAIGKITGDVGGALSGTNINFTGGTTGLLFSGAGTTETLTGTLVVANGGTGATTLTNHGVLVGQGTLPVIATAVGATGTVLIGNTAADPSFSATPSVTSMSIANLPAVGTDAANKAYVDTLAVGLIVKAACVAASTAVLTVIYNNGAAGVGATLTNAGVLAAFSIDGQSPTVGQRVLIKNQADQAQNGIYTVTTVGSGTVAWVLTRATDFDNQQKYFPEL